MERRDLLKWTFATGLLAPAPALARDSAPIQWLDVDALQLHMADARLTSASLASACLERVRALDQNGPALRSILQINPDTAVLAAALDGERRGGKLRGPLHGIPLVIKDCIATGDRMPTTMGSLALAGIRASRDAALVTRLREAGAVVLGKSNLTEWCNGRSFNSIAGWSAVGGLTRNPHDLERVCGGSSSGSAAAVAAGLVPLAVGTESEGSIVCPASICGVVGVKPTVGLISRSGMLVFSEVQDTPGPIARSVRDAAHLLEALAEPRAGRAPYANGLREGALEGKRLGVAPEFLVRDAQSRALFERAVAVLKARGATLVEVSIPNTDRYGEPAWRLLVHGFKQNLAAWLQDYAPAATVRSLADVIAFNKANAAQEMALFGQEMLVKMESKPLLEAKVYQDALDTVRRYAGREGLGAVLAEHKLDALIGITSIPGWQSDPKRRPASGASLVGPAAAAGYPHVTVPAGTINGMPVGLSFVGGAWREAELLALAYDFEQASGYNGRESAGLRKNGIN